MSKELALIEDEIESVEAEEIIREEFQSESPIIIDVTYFDCDGDGEGEGEVGEGDKGSEEILANITAFEKADREGNTYVEAVNLQTGEVTDTSFESRYDLSQGSSEIVTVKKKKRFL